MVFIDSITPEQPFQSGSETSREADVNAATFVGSLRERVFEWLAGREDGTQKECAAELRVERMSLTGRFCSLEICNPPRIVRTGVKREGCFAYRVLR